MPIPFSTTFGTLPIHGVEYLHWTSTCKGFKQFDVLGEILRSEIEEQLKEIVARGQLNEQDNPHLLLEKTLAIVSMYQAGHHGIRQQHGVVDVGQVLECLPITFEAIEYGLRYQRAHRIFHDKLIESKRKAGLIEESWKGSIVSYGVTLSKEDQEWIRSHAEEAARNKINVESEAIYVDFDNMEKSLSEAVFHLRRQGVEAISELILPDADSSGRSNRIWGCYSYHTLVKYVQRVYGLFLDEYATLVETNFPTLKGHFTLYAHMPVRCFIAVAKIPGDEEFTVDIYECHNSVGNTNEVILCDADQLVYDYRASKLVYSGADYDCFALMRTGMNHFFKTYPTYMDFPLVDQLTTLRNLVYRQIKREIAAAIDYLFKSYGVSRVVSAW